VAIKIQNGTKEILIATIIFFRNNPSKYSPNP